MRIVAVGLILLLMLSFSVYRGEAASNPEPKFTNLNWPVSLKFTPDGRIFFNEKNTGNIRIILPNGTILPTSFATVSPLQYDGETGLLGIALDPNFTANHFVYVYFTYRDNRNFTHGHIRRYTDSKNQGTNQTEIFDVVSSTPGTLYHNGGYIKFGPEGKLYAEVGEFHDGIRAQNLAATEGKILRMNPDGTIPSDNPFANSLVYAYGIRNSFGMDWDQSNGRFIETEAGDDTDEINIIMPGGNYGWPTCQGICHNPSFIDPIVQFYPAVTPTGIAYVAPNTYYFGEWNTADLNLMQLSSNGTVISITRVWTADSGLVGVELSPDGNLYLTTQDTIYVYQPSLPPTPSAGPFGNPLYAAALGSIIAVASGLLLYWKKGGRRVKAHFRPPNPSPRSDAT